MGFFLKAFSVAHTLGEPWLRTKGQIGTILETYSIGKDFISPEKFVSLERSYDFVILILKSF